MAMSRPLMKPTARRYYARLFGAALAIRLCCLVALHAGPGWPVEYPIDGEYEHFARQMVAGHELTNPYFPDAQLPSAWRPPLHAIVLAAVGWLAGFGTPAYYVSVYVLTSVVSAATVVFSTRTAEALAGRSLARTAGVLHVIYVPAIYYGTASTCDTALGACLVSAVSLTAVRLRRRPEARNALLVGGVGGAASLVNPATLVSTAALILWACVRPRSSRRSKRLAGGMIAAAALLLVLLPWTARNQRVLGHAFLLRSGMGAMLLAGNHAPDNDIHGRGFVNWLDSEREAFVSMGEVQFDRYCLSRALTWITNHPSDFAVLTIRRFGLYWTKEVVVGAFPGITLLTTGVPFLLAASAIWLTRRHQGALWPLVAPVVLIPLVYYVTLVEARYRFIVEPFLITFAGIAIHATVSAVVRRKARLGRQNPASRSDS